MFDLPTLVYTRTLNVAAIMWNSRIQQSVRIEVQLL